MNTVRLKYKMRKWLRDHHRPETPRMNMLPVWGKAARANAVVICGSPDERACWDALFPPTFGQKCVEVALGELGTKEHPARSNRGPRVDQYEMAVGSWVVGKPWCASFVTWCTLKAAKLLGVKAPRLPANAASVPSWTDMVRRGLYGWRRVEPADAKPGDVVTLWGSAHIERVRSVDVHGHVLHCIGGNTSVVGQNSNGGEVCETVRTFSEVTVVGRAPS